MKVKKRFIVVIAAMIMLLSSITTGFSQISYSVKPVQAQVSNELIYGEINLKDEVAAGSTVTVTFRIVNATKHVWKTEWPSSYYFEAHEVPAGPQVLNGNLTYSGGQYTAPHGSDSYAIGTFQAPVASGLYRIWLDGGEFENLTTGEKIDIGVSATFRVK